MKNNDDYQNIEKDFYDHLWKSVNGKFADDPNCYKSNVPSKFAIDFIKKYKPKGSFLDVGCGNGRHTRLFADNGFDSYGVDISRYAVEMAIDKSKKTKGKISFKVASVFDLPYPKEKFDVVLDSGCLHHLRKSQWASYKRNITRVLKKDGYYVLNCFSKSSPFVPGFSPKSKNRNFTLRKMHFNHFFTDEEIETLMGKHFNLLKKYEYTKMVGKPITFKVFYMRKK